MADRTKKENVDLHWVHRQAGMEERDALFWLTEKQIDNLQIQCDSLVSYLRERQSGVRRQHKLILKRIAHVREYLDLIENDLKAVHYSEEEIKHARELMETGITDISELVLQAIEKPSESNLR